MNTYLITGGKKVEGEINIQGAKNSVLPIIAGAILSGQTSVIKNCPDITDVHNMLDILKTLNCNVSYKNNILKIDSKNLTGDKIEPELMREMRSSIILMGAILARSGRVILSYPGGCEIGSRPIDLHLRSLKKIGANITEKHGFIICEAKELIGAEINLDFPSVGATENIMLAASCAKGITIIRNAAREPEIIELQDFLNNSGARVFGAGTSSIRIDGVEGLNGAKYNIRADRIVAGTYLCATAITGGEIILNNIVFENILAIIHKLQETGCEFRKISNSSIYLKAPRKLTAVNKIKTMPYPGFPTDMQSQIVSLLSVSEGTSIVVENIFENRFKYVTELLKMGAQIIVEGNTAIITGVKNLTGASVEAKDLRGGASLVLAGLIADGYTKVSGVNYIERGYENFASNLNVLGCEVKLEVGS